MNFLRNRFLNTAAFLSAPDDDGWSNLTASQTAAKQREEINVTSISKEPEPENENEPEKVEDEPKDEDNDEPEVGEDGEPEPEHEETEDEKKVRVAKAKEERKNNRQQRRIDTAIAEAKAAKAEAESLRKQLAENPKDGLTEEEVERRAEAKANEKLLANQQKNAQKEFETNCESLEKSAVKIDKEFVNKLTEMVQELGPVPNHMITILADLDNENGGDVLNYLTDNIDDADDVYALSPHKMTQKLMRISDKLKAAKRPAPKLRSNVPPPIEPVREGGRPETTVLTGKEDMDTFIRVRARQEEAKRKARGY